MRGGKRDGAGRKHGSKNAKSAEIAQKAMAAGLTPLEYMLDVLRTEPPANADPVVKASYTSLRFEAAKAAAPYCHPKLGQIEHTGPGGGPVQVQEVPWLRGRSL